jgi:hypothetical protein
MPETFNQARFIADKFGGATALAEALPGVEYHRVSDWCRRSRYIPERFRQAILEAAAARGIDVTPYDFIRHLVPVHPAPDARPGASPAK